MRSENHIVHGLWIGKELSALQLLTLKSFLQNGHEFHLWLYEPVLTPLPKGTVVRDATQVLARDSVFCYEEACCSLSRKDSPDREFGKGSFAGFSDIFRYRLLYLEGGWWSDMDVTCLRALDFSEPYVFRDHGIHGVVGNIMKCPKKSPLMHRCYQRTIREVTSLNTDWSKPIRILATCIHELGLSNFIKEGISNDDVLTEIEPFLVKDTPVPGSYYVIHWCNEALRFRGLSEAFFKSNSTFGRLLQTFAV